MCPKREKNQKKLGKKPKKQDLEKSSKNQLLKEKRLAKGEKGLEKQEKKGKSLELEKQQNGLKL